MEKDARFTELLADVVATAETKRIVSSEDVESAIGRLRAEGEEIVPFLTRTVTGKTEQRGRVFWAITLGALQELAPAESQATLQALASDSTDATRSDAAKRALDGKLLDSFRQPPRR